MLYNYTILQFNNKRDELLYIFNKKESKIGLKYVFLKMQK